jgi:hypothetical protein
VKGGDTYRVRNQLPKRFRLAIDVGERELWRVCVGGNQLDRKTKQGNHLRSSGCNS